MSVQGVTAESAGNALRWLWLSALVVGLDLGTKALASASLGYAESQAVLPFFNLTLLHNTGAAFSFLAGESGWQRWFFIVLAIVISAVLVVWLARTPRAERWLPVSVALVLGGAIGNVYDRIVHGYVVDFLHFYWGEYHFPAFNIADTAITIGAVMMAVDLFRRPQGNRGSNP
jgi:signal peptidase II